MDEILPQIKEVQLSADIVIAGLRADGKDDLILVQNGEASNYNPVGYVTAGYGALAADAMFVVSRYTRTFPVGYAMWLAYCGKRLAESTPSVGEKATDLFTITAAHGYSLFPPLGVAFLDSRYRLWRSDSQVFATESASGIDAALEGQLLEGLPPNQVPDLIKRLAMELGREKARTALADAAKLHGIDLDAIAYSKP